jgi:hypothetical protein
MVRLVFNFVIALLIRGTMAFMLELVVMMFLQSRGFTIITAWNLNCMLSHIRASVHCKKSKLKIGNK